MLVSMKTLCKDCREPYMLLGEGAFAAHYCCCCGNMVLLDRQEPMLAV